MNDGLFMQAVGLIDDSFALHYLVKESHKDYEIVTEFQRSAKLSAQL